MLTYHQRERIRNRLIIIGVTIIALINFFPVYYMILVSLQPLTKLIGKEGFTLIPADITFKNYERAIFKSISFLWFFKNGILVAIASMTLSLSISVPAGYSLARLRYPGKSFIDRSVLVLYIIPSIMLVIPIYLLFLKAGLLDTYLSIILVHSLLSVPFNIWLLRGFFQGIPQELDEAALIDGVSYLGVLFHVILPISTPGLVTAALFSFVVSWEEFLFASVFLTTASKQTLSIGLYTLFGTYGEVRWGQMMAAATIMAIPTTVLFLFFQRQFVRGLSAGAVKG